MVDIIHKSNQDYNNEEFVQAHEISDIEKVYKAVLSDCKVFIAQSYFDDLKFYFKCFTEFVCENDSRLS